MKELALVVAADLDGGIGAGGELPWRLPGEMRHFVAVTRTSAEGKRNAVIMGRRTWESIPARFRPLAGRLNVVLTRSAGLELPAAAVRAPDLDGVLESLAGDAAIDRAFVIGGATVYGAAIERPECREIVLTRVLARFPCDAFFPRFEDRFERVEILGEGSDGGVEYRFERWRRRD